MWSWGADTQPVTQLSPVEGPCRTPARSIAPRFAWPGRPALGAALLCTVLLAIGCSSPGDRSNQSAASQPAVTGSVTTVALADPSSPSVTDSVPTTPTTPTTLSELVADDEDFVELIDFGGETPMDLLDPAVDPTVPTVPTVLTVPTVPPLRDPTVPPVPVPEPAAPETAAPVPAAAEFALPPSPTIPKQFEPAHLALHGMASVDGVSFGVPKGWLLLSTPADVEAAAALSPDLRTKFVQGLEGDPNRRYLIPRSDLNSVSPTWAAVVVTVPTDLSTLEITTRFEQYAVQSEGLRVAARAHRSWMDRRGLAMLFKGQGDRRRLSIAARLPDRRAVIVQTEGYSPDLASLHALLVLSVMPGPSVPATSVPAPLPTSIAKR